MAPELKSNNAGDSNMPHHASFKWKGENSALSKAFAISYNHKKKVEYSKVFWERSYLYVLL